MTEIEIKVFEEEFDPYFASGNFDFSTVMKELLALDFTPGQAIIINELVAQLNHASLDEFLRKAMNAEMESMY